MPQMTMMIRSAVGANRAPNDSSDVMIVQELLNDHRPPPEWILEDGRCGPQTIEAIRVFQWQVIHDDAVWESWSALRKMRRPDGRVDPGGTTITLLNDPEIKARYAGGSGPAPPASSRRPPAAEPEVADPTLAPFRLAYADLQRFPDAGSAHAPALVTDNHGVAIQAGQPWKAKDGERLVVSVVGGHVIYLLFNPKNLHDGTPFGQGRRGFDADTRWTPIAEGARRAAGMVIVAEYEMHLLMGIVGASSGLGLAALLGTDALQFCAQNRERSGRWVVAVGALFAAKATLKRCSRTLHDKVVDAVLLSLLTGLSWAVINGPETIARDPKLSARATGAMIGKIGKNAFARRLSALRLIWYLLSTLIIKSFTAEKEKRTGICLDGHLS